MSNHLQLFITVESFLVLNLRHCVRFLAFHKTLLPTCFQTTLSSFRFSAATNSLDLCSGQLSMEILMGNRGLPFLYRSTPGAHLLNAFLAYYFPDVPMKIISRPFFQAFKFFNTSLGGTFFNLRTRDSDFSIKNGFSNLMKLP